LSLRSRFALRPRLTIVTNQLRALVRLPQLLYFADTYCFEASGRVVAALPPDEGAAGASQPGALTLLLDRTIFYPAGGGQPADAGELRAPLPCGGEAVFRVTDVRLKDGAVRHTGAVAGPPEARAAFAPGAAVALRVDGAARQLHARVHSAGHLLDVCMARCGYPPAALVPTKGLHGAEAAYVEYAGKVPPEDCEALKGRLNAALAAAVAAGGRTAAAVLPYDAAAAACHVAALPPYIAPGATPRIVTMLPGEPGCPCGGTHVDDVARIGGVTVTEVRVKKGVTRISYRVEGMLDAAPTAAK
jgi:Ser-tRNA(Ala) deacylase AlaX